MTHANINYITQADEKRLIGQLSEMGVKVYELHGENISNASRFFHAINQNIPLDQAVYGSWDALADSMFEGLSTAGDQQAAIVWTAASIMKRVAVNDFQMAVAVLGQVCQEIGSAKINLGRCIELRVFLVSNDT